MLSTKSKYPFSQFYTLRAFLILASTLDSSLFMSCSQSRITFQPFLRRIPFTNLSRALFASIFSFQNCRFCTGIVLCFVHPCQKQPSTKTAVCIFGKIGRAHV